MTHLARNPESARDAVLADEILVVVFHRFHVVGEVSVVPPIAVHRQLEAVDLVATPH